jgi:secreted trypsin-like serine protease
MKLIGKTTGAVLFATSFILALFLFSSFALAKSGEKEGRIYGDPVDKKDWPHFVAFTDKGTNLYNRCAGVLVSPRWVLTAPSGCMADRLKDSMAFVGATQSNPYDGKKEGLSKCIFTLAIIRNKLIGTLTQLGI